jgi:two-component system probable response regulator PhcQ
MPASSRGRFLPMSPAMDAMPQSAIRCTVLFVDDEPHVLGALRDALRKYPFTILTATGGAQALELLESREVDVVVSDERMPGMTGSEFLSIVRQKHPHTIRIILTGQASLAAAMRAINEGEVYRFLTKPCAAVDLAVTIQRALQLRNLARESARLLARTRAQDRILHELEDRHPGISDVKRNLDGAILLDDIADIDELVRQIVQQNC